MTEKEPLTPKHGGLQEAQEFPGGPAGFRHHRAVLLSRVFTKD